MNSIVLCEGPDDLRFISYYLHKKAGWDEDHNPAKRWRAFRVKENNNHQKVFMMKNGDHGVAIWCVGGKDSFSLPLKTIVDKFIREIPAEAVKSIVYVRDRDNDSVDDIIDKIKECLPENIDLINKCSNTISIACNDGANVHVSLTPVIIPFNEAGAIETLLMQAVREKSDAGEFVVNEASKYIDKLVENDIVRREFYSHERLILKSKYSATIAVTNPDHSTGLFGDMMMATPWEESEYVDSHFSIIARALIPE